MRQFFTRAARVVQLSLDQTTYTLDFTRRDEYVVTRHRVSQLTGLSTRQAETYLGQYRIVHSKKDNLNALELERVAHWCQKRAELEDPTLSTERHGVWGSKELD